MIKHIVILMLILCSTLNISYAQQTNIFNTESTLFSNDNEFLKVDEAFVFDYFQNEQQLELTFNIKPGHYLYLHQFKFTAENATITPVQLPDGVDHEDEFFGVQKTYQTPTKIIINIEKAQENATLKIRYQGCAEKGLCYPPTTKTIELSAIISPTEAANTNDIVSLLTPQKTEQNSSAKEINNSSSEQFELASMLAGDNLLLTLAAFFVGGLLLSFTPCVFPMYPILTGIIVGQGDKLSTKRAFSLSFFYVQGMAITYTILGIVVALAGAQFQAMFQHPILLIGLSILFVLLALSMFGTFNLALPSSWQNKLNSISNKQEGGSYLGVLSMGAISGLVASPCTTAPLTGALIFIAESGDVITGASALYALSLGMGLPLLILGSSGGKILPKAGNWMNIIKNIFGLLLLAVPIFLLERFIPATATQALWALLALAAGSYFYLANQQTNKNFAHGLRFAIIFLLLFFGASKLYNLAFPNEVVITNEQQAHQTFIKVSNLADIKAAIKGANENGNTVMLDLYADWCIACKEFEEYTFPDANVKAALANTILLQMDLTETGSDASIEIMETYEVFGLPSILFFDLQGKELNNKRVTGFMKADEFTTHLKTFL